LLVGHEKNVKGTVIEAPGVRNVVKKALIGPREGWASWVMRTFTVGREGFTPRHSHSWPHINYVLDGRGVLFLDGKEHQVERGSIAYIPGGAEHQFMNTGDGDLVLICIVPEEGDV